MNTHEVDEMLSSAERRICESSNLSEDLSLVFRDLAESLREITSESALLSKELEALRSQNKELERKNELLEGLIDILPEALRLISEVPDVELRGRLWSTAQRLQFLDFAPPRSSLQLAHALID